MGWGAVTVSAASRFLVPSGEANPAFPFCSDGMVTFGRAIRLDQMSNCTGDFELLTGKKPKSVREVTTLFSQ